MGGGHWSSSFWHHVNAAHRAAGTDPFAHTANIRAGRAAARVHAALDPLNVKSRELRDSAEHPNSSPIAVLFNVTGSMGAVPKLLQEKLAGLMTLLVKKGYVPDPQILFGGVGNVECDAAPLQVGQFESDNRMDECLTKIFLEGGGGGQKQESYDLALYFMARKTALNSLDKRGRRGHLFLIGDELYRDCVSRDAVRNVIGDRLEADIPIAEIVGELRRKFDTYFIIPLADACHGRDPEIYRKWAALLGQDHVLRVEGVENICEVIGLTIGLAEGTVETIDDGVEHLRDIGAGADAVRSVSKALVPVVAGRGLVARLGTMLGRLPAIPGGGKSERL